MQHYTFAAVALALSLSNASHATEIPGYLGVGYVDSKIQPQDPALRGNSLDGNGFIGELLMPVGSTAFIQTDYQAVEYDNVDLDLNIARAGLGFRLPLARGITAAFSGQYWNLEQKSASSSFDDDGFGIKGGVHVDMNRPITGWFNVSYLELDSSSGNEMEIGLDLRITTMMAVFLSYRALELNPNDGSLPDLEADEVRAGLRLWYDASE